MTTEVSTIGDTPVAEPKFTAGVINKHCPRVLRDLGKHIQAHLDKARKYEEKAEQHQVAVAQLLLQAKGLCDEPGFEAFREKVCPEVGRSRAYEMLQLATGKKSLKDIRASTRERVARHRANRAAPPSVTVTDSPEPDPTNAVPTEGGEGDAEAGRRESPATDLAEPGNTGPVENDPAAADGAVVEHGLDAAGDHQHHDQHDAHGGEVAGEPPFFELLDFWKLAAAEEKQEVLTHEGVNGLLNLLKRDQDLLFKLYDHVIGQQVALASPVKASTSSKKLLVSITGTMHWALGQDDPAAGAQALTIIKAKLSASKRDPKDICFCFAKTARTEVAP